MHIGRGKVGNLQRTRPYVAGRNLWGALTARLTRDGHPQGKPDPQTYQDIGRKVHEELAFSYFYPTTDQDGAVDPWPWDDGFRWRFLSTYASTALDYGTASAEEASLHEVECIVPHARKVQEQNPDGEPSEDKVAPPVYLIGYVLQRQPATLRWRSALKRLQIGGERGYGWGRVEPMGDPQPSSDAFSYDLDLSKGRPLIHVPAGQHLLAHALAADPDRSDQAFPAGAVEGSVEPLVGRVTKPGKGFGTTFSQARICYAPGARATKALDVQIGPFGIWERAGATAEEKEP
jgi:hypothetical protein